MKIIVGTLVVAIAIFICEGGNIPKGLQDGQLGDSGIDNIGPQAFSEEKDTNFFDDLGLLKELQAVKVLDNQELMAKIANKNEHLNMETVRTNQQEISPKVSAQDKDFVGERGTFRRIRSVGIQNQDKEGNVNNTPNYVVEEQQEPIEILMNAIVRNQEQLQSEEYPLNNIVARPIESAKLLEEPNTSRKVRSVNTGMQLQQQEELFSESLDFAASKQQQSEEYPINNIVASSTELAKLLEEPITSRKVRSVNTGMQLQQQEGNIRGQQEYTESSLNMAETQIETSQIQSNFGNDLGIPLPRKPTFDVQEQETSGDKISHIELISKRFDEPILNSINWDNTETYRKIRSVNIEAQEESKKPTLENREDWSQSKDQEGIIRGQQEYTESSLNMAETQIEPSQIQSNLGNDLGIPLPRKPTFDVQEQETSGDKISHIELISKRFDEPILNSGIDNIGPQAFSEEKDTNFFDDLGLLKELPAVKVLDNQELMAKIANKNEHLNMETVRTNQQEISPKVSAQDKDFVGERGTFRRIRSVGIQNQDKEGNVNNTPNYVVEEQQEPIEILMNAIVRNQEQLQSEEYPLNNIVARPIESAKLLEEPSTSRKVRSVNTGMQLQQQKELISETLDFSALKQQQSEEYPLNNIVASSTELAKLLEEPNTSRKVRSVNTGMQLQQQEGNIRGQQEYTESSLNMAETQIEPSQIQSNFGNDLGIPLPRKPTFDVQEQETSGDKISHIELISKRFDEPILNSINWDNIETYRKIRSVNIEAQEESKKPTLENREDWSQSKDQEGNIRGQQEYTESSLNMAETQIEPSQIQSNLRNGLGIPLPRKPTFDVQEQETSGDKISHIELISKRFDEPILNSINWDNTETYRKIRSVNIEAQEESKKPTLENREDWSQSKVSGIAWPNTQIKMVQRKRSVNSEQPKITKALKVREVIENLKRLEEPLRRVEKRLSKTRNRSDEILYDILNQFFNLLNALIGDYEDNQV